MCIAKKVFDQLKIRKKTNISEFSSFCSTVSTHDHLNTVSLFSNNILFCDLQTTQRMFKMIIIIFRKTVVFFASDIHNQSILSKSSPFLSHDKICFFFCQMDSRLCECQKPFSNIPKTLAWLSRTHSCNRVERRYVCLFVCPDSIISKQLQCRTKCFIYIK